MCDRHLEEGREREIEEVSEAEFKEREKEREYFIQ